MEKATLKDILLAQAKTTPKPTITPCRQSRRIMLGPSHTHTPHVVYEGTYQILSR